MPPRPSGSCGEASRQSPPADGAWRRFQPLTRGPPTGICPSFVNATTDGNIFPPYVEPSALGMILGVPPSMYAASEFVVPRSMPMILPLVLTFFSHDDDL